MKTNVETMACYFYFHWDARSPPIRVTINNWELKEKVKRDQFLYLAGKHFSVNLCEFYVKSFDLQTMVEMPDLLFRCDCV